MDLPEQERRELAYQYRGEVIPDSGVPIEPKDFNLFYVVFYSSGGFRSGEYTEELAIARAKEIDGIVVSLVISHDYRKPVAE